MPETIFLLPHAGLVRPDVTLSEYAARIVEAVPDDWSDVSGLLQPPDHEECAVASAGYAFHRFDPGVRIAARQGPGGQIAHPDLKALLVDGRLPAFVSFDDTGFDARWQLLAARDLAAGFLRKGFLGWLRFNNGRRREYSHQKPVEVEIHLQPWSRAPAADGPLGPRQHFPPAVCLRWDPDLGGTRDQAQSIVRACHLACREVDVIRVRGEDAGGILERLAQPGDGGTKDA